MRVGGLFAVLLILSSSLRADVGHFESEPNNEPEDFNQITGSLTLYGTLEGQDQDGYLWSVSDDDARKRWRFELHGIPSAALTQVNVMRPVYAENGVDIIKYDDLFKMGTRDGARPSIQEGLVFEPGDYVLGFSGAGLSVTPESEAKGGYRFYISESKLPLVKDPGSQDTYSDAHAISPGREFVTFESDALAWYQLNFDAGDVANRWAISVRVPVGRRVQASLHNAEGRELLSQRSNDKGVLSFAHLVPPEGPWYIKISAKDAGMIQAITSEPIGAHIAGEEAEPNNKRRDANQVDLPLAITGRIGGSDAEDFFTFRIPDSDGSEGGGTRLQALVVESDAPGKMTVCLRWMAGKDSQCKTGTPPLRFPALGLNTGDWYLQLRKAKEQSYRIRLEDEGGLKPGGEVEPNDQIELATGVSEKLRIRGHFSGEETDHYQLIITEEAQLWRLQVNGDGLDSIAYLDGRGRVKVSRKADKGARRVRLDNVFLPPGRHVVRLKGEDGSYMLLARPLGPPVAAAMPSSPATIDSKPEALPAAKLNALWNPDGEVEPNDVYNMQRLAVGQTRTGSLPDSEDEDFYRFFVANDDHLELSIESPEDGVIQPYLRWYDTQIGSAEKRAAGELITYTGLLPPGDYTLRLTTPSPSDKPYRLRLERLPRFGCDKDCEPNDLLPLRRAAPLPLDLRLQGSAQTWRDADAYRLPVFEQDVSMQLLSETALHRAYLADAQGNRSPRLQYDKAFGGYDLTIPAGQQSHLVITGQRGKSYDVQVIFPNGERQAVEGALKVRAEMEIERDTVAAFLDVGQRLSGQIKVDNQSDQQQMLSLALATSDHRWRVEADQNAQERMALLPGESVVIPIRVSVPADAWADHTVRVSAMVQGQQGRHVETWADIEVARSGAGVNPHMHWPIPDSLRGGFNAAWLPFGAQVTGDSPKKVADEALRDGLVFPRASIRCCGGTKNWKEGLGHTWSLELPGDKPMPVAGIALDAFGANILHSIKKASLRISLDGANYQEVLSFETQPVLTEQYFAVPTPVLARFVQLHIESTHEYPSNNIALGEWKVLLQPGFDVSGGRGFNVADPDLGGHVVWNLPAISGAAGVLEDRAKARTLDLRSTGVANYVLGFNRNRAAKISRLVWHYDERSTEKTRTLSKVRMWRSTDSPIGPWIKLGEVSLDPAQTSFEFAPPEAEYARFVRFEAIIAEGERRTSEPGRIEIWEPPTDSEYTSILTEWGEAGGRADYEARTASLIETVEPLDNVSRQQAMELELGATLNGAVSLGKTLHWYKIEIPSDVNTLTFNLAGQPTVRTALALQDAQGRVIPLKELRDGKTPRMYRYDALVEPNQTVFLKVEEPPRNVVFSWDTSGSVGNYIPRINNSVMAFSGEVRENSEWVNLLPFGSGLLLNEWTDQANVLQTVLNDFRRESDSSAAELALHKASHAMRDRAGTKAVVIVTDAVTPYFGEMWHPMAEVQPRIFGIGVGGSGIEEQNRFRDWAMVNGGDYRQLRYLGEMDVAFDRASTKMHRPATYALTVNGEFREAPGPGTLFVRSSAKATSAVALVLDASGSMLKRLQGKRRIDIAKQVLMQAVEEKIPAGTPLSLRVFGHKEVDSCRTDLELPLGPLDPAKAAQKIERVIAKNLARTPIADSLAAIEKDLKGNTNAVVVLVTDGEETCDGDPAVVIQGLQDKGFDINLNIVGFAIDDPELDLEFARWAELGGGRYFGADDESGLQNAIQQALKVPFSVIDQNGETVTAGQVDGEGLNVEAGVYSVVISGKSPQSIENVIIHGEDEVIVRLEEPRH